MLSASACEWWPFGYTSIADVVQSPGDYEGKTVKVRGRVSETAEPAASSRYYVLRQGDAELTVFTGEPVPPVGAEVSVIGTAESATIVGGVGLGLHLREQRRR